MLVAKSKIAQHQAVRRAGEPATAPKADANSSRGYLSRRATKISAEFGCRPDTVRERRVYALLIKAVHGAQTRHASHLSLVSRPFTRRNFDAGQLLRA